MFRLFHLLAALCLFASLASGSIVHAAEIVGGHEATGASQSLHVDGDDDQVPGDRENGQPHHHDLCNGHDMATPAKAFAPSPHPKTPGTLLRLTSVAPATGPATSLLRPPIA